MTPLHVFSNSSGRRRVGVHVLKLLFCVAVFPAVCLPDGRSNLRRHAQGARGGEEETDGDAAEAAGCADTGANAAGAATSATGGRATGH